MAGFRRAPLLLPLLLLLQLGAAPLWGAAAAAKPSYYEVLGVPKDADTKAIKSAYRKMALKWHPDKHTEDKEAAEIKFREVAEAYEVLSDPERRKRYDMGGDPNQGGFGGGGGGGGPGADFGFGDFFGRGGGFKDPKDLFKEMFGDADPFADFSKFFDDIQFEEFGGGAAGGGGASSDAAADAKADFERALASLYAAAGQSDKASSEKARELLAMPKWVGKERKLYNNLRRKYSEPQYTAALNDLGSAVETLERHSSRRQRGGGGGFGGFDMGGFGGFGDLDKAFGGGFGGGFGGFGGFEGFGGGFGGGGGGGASMSFSSSFSTSSGGKTTKQETKIVNGKRVTKTIETDASGTRATLEEEADGRIKRQTGTRKADQERLGRGRDEM